MLIVFPLLIVVTGAALAALRVARQEQQPAKQEAEITERQREHAKLYKGYGTGKKLRDIVKGSRSGIKVKRNTPLPVGVSGASPITLPDLLKGMACNADAVIIGEVKGQSSQLTEDGEFIFTDYELSVGEVLKDNKSAHLISDISITVTRPGGSVQLEDHLVEAEDASFRPLRLGERYILFLRFLPITGTYTSVNSTSSFEIRDNKIRAQTDEPMPSGLNYEGAVAFLEKVHEAIPKACGEKKGKL